LGPFGPLGHLPTDPGSTVVRGGHGYTVARRRDVGSRGEFTFCPSAKNSLSDGEPLNVDVTPERGSPSRQTPLRRRWP